ncbi:MAG: NblA/ycf18 family protein [Geitlerinemataceae cyanobacterium]
MNDSNLSLEQEFNVKSFETTVASMSREQAQQSLVRLYRDSLVREETYKNLLKHHWGIGDSPLA